MPIVTEGVFNAISYELSTLNLFIFFQVYFGRTHPVFIYTSINCTNISICVKLYKYKQILKL